MSYTPTEWKTGDVVTAQKLNKIETGISESGSSTTEDILYIHFNLENTDYIMEESYTGGQLWDLLKEDGKKIIGLLYSAGAPFLQTSVHVQGGRGSYGIADGMNFIFYNGFQNTSTILKVAQDSNTVTVQNSN